VYATYLLFDPGGSHARVSNTQVVVLTTGVAARYRFPKADDVARTRVVETLQEALVVLDWDDHVLDVNEATADLFDPPAETMIGTPIGSVVDGLGGTNLPAGVTGTVALRTSNGRRQFQFSVSAADEATADDEDNPVARTVLFRDVTDRRTREQRLTVLNCILPHNVRNDLDVVLAYASQIDDEEIRAGVRENTAAILELSRKVRDAAEVMVESTEPPESVDLTDVARTVVDQFRADDASANISLVCPDDVLISSHRAVLRRALSELVEDSLEHTTTDSYAAGTALQRGCEPRSLVGSRQYGR
jgi:signal transduction histidine kinase